MNRLIKSTISNLIALLSLTFVGNSISLSAHAYMSPVQQKNSVSEQRKLRKVRSTLARAMRNLAAIDARIADQKADLKLFNELSPRDPEQETSVYESSYADGQTQLEILQKKRAELAANIKHAATYYNIGFTDLKPARNYASSETR